MSMICMSFAFMDVVILFSTSRNPTSKIEKYTFKNDLTFTAMFFLCQTKLPSPKQGGRTKNCTSLHWYPKFHNYDFLYFGYFYQIQLGRFKSWQYPKFSTNNFNLQNMRIQTLTFLSQFFLNQQNIKHGRTYVFYHRRVGSIRRGRQGTLNINNIIKYIFISYVGSK